jgi:uncharacterized membrane protein YdjX (TVP38/TMEM64 family)
MEKDGKNQQIMQNWGLWVRLSLFLLGLFVILTAARAIGLLDNIGYIINWIISQGVLGAIVFIFLYILVMALGLPRSGLTVLGGVVFGSIMGTIIVTIASVTGATAAFLIARYLARDKVQKWVRNRPKLLNLYNLSETYGSFIVALVRMLPVSPANILNFAFGLTKIRLEKYIFWTFATMLPGNAIFVIGADAIMEGIYKQQVPWILVLCIFVLAIILLIFSKTAFMLLSKNKEQAGKGKF